MTPEEHTELINSILTQPLVCVEVMSDLVQALTRLREILVSFPRPALEQLIEVVRQNNDRGLNSEPIRTALTEITKRLDALYTLL